MEDRGFGWCVGKGGAFAARLVHDLRLAVAARPQAVSGGHDSRSSKAVLLPLSTRGGVIRNRNYPDFSKPSFVQALSGTAADELIDIMARSSAAVPSWKSWNGLVYYGETLGFFAAWIAGATAIAYSAVEPDAPKPAVEQVAVADTNELAYAN